LNKQFGRTGKNLFLPTVNIRRNIAMKRTTIILTFLMALAILLSACAPATTPAAPASLPTGTAAPAATASVATAVAPSATVAAATSTAAPTETLAATATASASSGPISMKDPQGNEVKLDGPAQKIISLAPSNTEILFAIGAGKQVIAREDFSNFPDEAKSLPSVGGSDGKYNLEQIAKLQPDLILVSPLTPADQIKALKDITPNVFVVENPKDLDGLYANLVTVGQLTGHQSNAEALSNDLRTRAKAVTDKLAGVTEKPKVFYELDATDPSKPWTAGPGTFIDILISLAGGQNIGASLKGDYVQISQEELLIQNPDFVLLGDSLYGGIKPAQVATRPGWKDIAAVKNNRVLEFNDDLVSRPGPRLIDGLEALAKILHPDLFK
jgi:cobalamin transport system substrate-binding protein